MRKIILISLFAILGIALNAQQVMRTNENFIAYNGITADAASGTTALTKDFVIKKEYFYNYDIYCNLDSAGDGTNFTVALQGTIDDVNFTTITSATWYVSSSDTTINFNNLAETDVLASYTELHTGTSSLASYTTLGTGTLTKASYLEVWDTASANGDSVTVGAQTTTRADTLTHAAQTVTYTDTVTVGAQTTTTTTAAILWPRLRISITGAGASAGCSIDYINIMVAPKEW